jgi:hypothetical protein
MASYIRNRAFYKLPCRNRPLGDIMGYLYQQGRSEGVRGGLEYIAEVVYTKKSEKHSGKIERKLVNEQILRRTERTPTQQPRF